MQRFFQVFNCCRAVFIRGNEFNAEMSTADIDQSKELVLSLVKSSLIKPRAIAYGFKTFKTVCSKSSKNVSDRLFVSDSFYDFRK